MKRVSFVLFALVFFQCWRSDPPVTQNTSVSIKLTINGGGTVLGFPSDSTVLKGDTLILDAQPDSGYIFSGWNIDRFTNNSQLVISVDETLVIVAHFVKIPDDLVFIPAQDSVFTMGAKATTAPAIERPSHLVRFSYDFFMARSEVTRNEYRKIMGDAQGFPFGTENDSLPVSNITWYDAIRYCNELSKRAGYDTIYSYTARCGVVGACPYVLENCAIHYDRAGYRLPTEAEWEYACRAGSATTYFWGDDASGAETYAWYFENATNILHPGRMKKPNSFGLYDIAGNVAEWVNDWLDTYNDTLVVNPVGPLYLTEEQFSESWERPIKGGSYRLEASFLRPSVRKGPYPMPAEVVQQDIGFRVALGAFGALQTAPGVIVNDSIDAQIVVEKSDLIAIVGTHKIKTAFVLSTGNKSRYCAVADFSTSPVVVRTCSSDSAVYAPVISPDGHFIVWGSKDEGAGGRSTISVRALSGDFPLTDSMSGFLPRFWVDPAMSDTFIVYTSGASIDIQPQWYNEKTLKRKLRGGRFEGDAEVLWEHGSYHGGLSSDGRYLGTAFTVAKLVDLQLSDTNIFYFVPPWNGRNDTPQVCNLSMSPSKTNPGEALFLDFGYSGRSTLAGRAYGLHEILFVANTTLFSNEHISGMYVVPAPYKQWNYTEYTNHPARIAAVAQPSGVNDDDALYCINADDSTYVKILEAKLLRDVAIWIDPQDVSEIEDPYRHFGHYDKPIQTAGQVVQAKKLRLFWHERENVRCVAIGNSPMMYGFDPRQITVLPTLSVAWYQSSIGGSVTIAQEYLLPNTPNLDVLIIDLDASYFTVDSRQYLRLNGLYYTDGYQLDSRNNFYREGIPAGVKEKIAFFSAREWSGFDSLGAFTDSIIGDGWGEPVIEGNDYSLEDSIVKVNLALFEELLDSATARGVKVLAINFPQNPAYATTAMAGRAGPSHATYDKLAEHMAALTKKYPGFHFYDANNGGDHDYGSSEALDANHLNSRGAGKLAARVDSLLQIILK